MSQSALTESRPAAANAEGDSDSGLSPADIFRMLWGHRWFILACALTCLACSLVYVRLKKPLYEASAIIRIDPGRAGSLGLSDLSGNASSSDLTLTEIAVLESDGVALRTLNSLSSEDFFQLTGKSRAAYPLPAKAEDLSEAQQGLVDGFKAGVSAKQVEGTQFISVSFRSQKPRLAADVANHLVSAYMIQTFVDRDNSVAQLRTWLGSQMAALKDEVDAAQKRLASFEEQNHVIATQGSGNNITDRLRVLTDSLAAAQAARIAREADLRAAKTGDSSTLAALFPDTRLTVLGGQQAALETKYQQLSSKFGAKYPPLTEVQEQMQAADTAMSDEIQSMRRRLQKEFDTASTAEKLLQDEYDAQAHLAYAFNRNEAEFTVLQAEVNSSRELYDTLRRKLQQASVDAQVNGLDTMLVDDARVPSRPVAPEQRMILGGGLVLGLFAGIVAAFLVEATSDKLQSAGQVGKTVGCETIAVIPRDLSERRDAGKIQSESSLVVLRSPLSRVAEAYRAVRNLILLSAHRAPPKVLLVTSASKAETPSEVTANYAVALAQAGYRVLVVDADRKRPSLHLEFGVENGAGLGGRLHDPAAAIALRQPVESLPRLALLTAGEDVSATEESAVLEGFRSALQTWRTEFDYIIVQSASPLEVSDGLLLANWADAVLLVARHSTTRLGVLAQLYKLLRRTEAHVMGVLVHNVPAR